MAGRFKMPTQTSAVVTIERRNKELYVSIKMSTPDGMEMMQLNSIDRDGNCLKLDCLIMGSMPMTVVLQPSEARKVFGMLNWRLVVFLLTFLFRG